MHDILILLNNFLFSAQSIEKKFFSNEDLELEFKKLTKEICNELKIQIIAMECHIDHVHLFLKCWPQQSPSHIMKMLKGKTSLILRNKFNYLTWMKNLWIRSYFVSTAGNVSSKTIKWYIDTQKTK